MEIMHIFFLFVLLLENIVLTKKMEMNNLPIFFVLKMLFGF